ncbi:hypothetical protein MNR01_13240 [Lysobacter sp. S4-A87]|uniref:CheR family methyltransferase n=1 Tax=Lysobacter sp. S4-A87 TaxID=2925843 RepID=UPI001F533389|nr:CheR family methyltransferase [Lysobacter sp. S4-A87]UNK48701.1 hypothetical protein MNR01_13240 [Lysobacter sp. S4-A87]
MDTMKNHSNGLLAAPLLPLARRFWQRLPPAVLASRPMRRLGAVIYNHYVRYTDRSQSHYTWFLRNPPQLALAADLICSARPERTSLRVMSVGCSVGAELYSLLWLVRKTQPDISIDARGIDIVHDAIASARQATYRLEAPSSSGGTLWVDGKNVLSTSSDAVDEIFDLCPNGAYRVKDTIRAGTSWHVDDAADPGLSDRHGLQDAVLACNFLGPMGPQLAERCLRNLANLLVPGGYLILDGIDLDLKARVVKDIGLLPITEDAQCIHESDPTKQDWPWTRWSLEPFDESRADWPYRYATIFQRPMLLERTSRAFRPPAPAMTVVPVDSLG